MTNAGRKKLRREVTKKHISIYKDQIQRLKELGGSKWIRDKIDEVANNLNYKELWEDSLKTITMLQGIISTQDVANDNTIK